MLDNCIKVLDNECSDLRVVNAARVSFNKQQDKINPIKDTKLINYLASHNHWTPFSHSIFTTTEAIKLNIGVLQNQCLMAAINLNDVCSEHDSIFAKVTGSFYAFIQLMDYIVDKEQNAAITKWLDYYMPRSSEAHQLPYIGSVFNAPYYHLLKPAEDCTTLHIKMPVFAARQWFKHTVGFTRNEVSRRYVNYTPEFFIPEQWREGAETIKQGSTDSSVEVYYSSAAGCEVAVDKAYMFNTAYIADEYNDMIEANICSEQARMILPQSMYTEFYETASLDSYKRLISLRDKPDAQKEIRDYANTVKELLCL